MGGGVVATTSSSAGPGTTNNNPGASDLFIYKPGAATAGNVYGTEAAMFAAWNKVPPPKRMAVDASLVAGTATLTLAWNLNGCTLFAMDTAALDTLQFAIGATIVGTEFWTVGAGLTVTNLGAGVWTPANGSVVNVEENSLLASFIAATPFVTIGAGVTLFLGILPFGLVGDDVNPTFNLTNATAVLSAVGVGSNSDDQLGQHSCEGVAGSTVNFAHDAETFARNITVAGQIFNETKNDTAGEMAYTAAVVGNWSGTNPSSVANALDRIAAKITPIP